MKKIIRFLKKKLYRVKGQTMNEAIRNVLTNLNYNYSTLKIDEEENIIDIKCIGNTLIMLMNNNNNTSIITSTLNTQNSVSSITSAIASIQATPIPFANIDIISIGKNWQPLN